MDQALEARAVSEVEELAGGIARSAKIGSHVFDRTDLELDAIVVSRIHEKT
jgi:hypothetical protein